MIRKFTFLFFLAFSFGLLNAQSVDSSKELVLYEQSFDDWATSGWRVEHTGDGDGWKSSANGNNGACAYKGLSTGVSSSWLISPQIEITCPSVLKFFEKNQFMESVLLHGLYISEKSDDTWGFDFEQKTAFHDNSDTWTERSFDLSEYVGKSIYIAFKHNSNDGSSWRIDDLKIVNENEHELEIVSGRVYGPTYPAVACPVRVKVTNNGAADETGVEVVASEGTYTSTQTVDIPVGETVEVVFDEYTVKDVNSTVNVTVNLDGDNQPDNNTIDLPVYPIHKPAYAYVNYSASDIYRSPAVFDQDHPEMMHAILKETPTEQVWGGLVLDGVWYVATVEKNADKKYEPRNISRVNMETGEYEVIAPTNVIFYALSYNPSDKKVYGIGTEGISGPRNLYTLDLETGASTKIADCSYPSYLSTFAINEEGKAYGINNIGMLYEINLTDFTWTAVATTDITPKYSQTMAFNHEDGKLYWTAYYSDGSNQGKMFTVDVETAETTLVCDYFGGRCRINSLAYPITTDNGGGTAEGFEESFETWPAADWSIYTLAEGDGFTQGTVAPYAGEAFAARYDQFKDCDDWLVSPKVTVSEGFVLEFAEANRYTETPNYEHHGLYISTGSGNPEDGDFVLLQEMKEAHDIWTKLSFDLSDYVGQDIYIGFHYTGNFASIWEIDAVKVGLPVQYDFAVTLGSMPTLIKEAQEVTPRVRVDNVGAQDLNDIIIKLNVDGIDTESRIVNIPAGEYRYIGYTAMNIDSDTDFTFTASHELDEFPDNNKCSLHIKAVMPGTAFAYAYSSADESALPLGPVTFSTSDVKSVTSLPTKSEDDIVALSGTMINNMWFANFAQIPENSDVVPACYALIDTETGEYYSMYKSENVFMDMAYNYNDDKVYAINQTETDLEVYTVDYRTGEVVKVGTSAECAKLRTLAIDLEGNAYGIANDKQFYSFNLATMETTLIAPTGVLSLAYNQSMAFDHNTGNLFWNQSDAVFAAFYNIDPVTGECIKFDYHTQYAKMAAFGFKYGEDKYYAVAHVIDNDGNAVEGADIKIESKTLKSDDKGYAVFIDLEKDANYTAAVSKGELSTTIDFTMDEAKVVDMLLDHVGLNDIAAQNISVFPNPSNGVVNINGIEDIERIQLVDMNGCVVKDDFNVVNTSLNLSQFNNGVYTLRVFAAQQAYSYKLVLRK